MSEIVVSKFGGTSVADFDAMNRSADIVLSDANVRLVVLSASAGITNLLVALAEGLEPGERFEKLDAFATSSLPFWNVCVTRTLSVKRLNVCWRTLLFWQKRRRWQRLRR
jgi:Aspartokinases